MTRAADRRRMADEMRRSRSAYVAGRKRAIAQRLPRDAALLRRIRIENAAGEIIDDGGWL